MRDMWKRLLGILDHVAKSLQPIAPAFFLGALVIAALASYTPPKAEQYQVAAADVNWDNISLFGREDEEETTEEKAESAEGEFELEDGTYRGSAQGYGGEITVDVTISGGSITAIDIVSAPGETEPFFTRAKGVIDALIMAQSTKVDVVSGATFSSNGIIGAVENALYGTTSTQTAAAPAAGQAGPAPTVSSVDESGSYKDGVYTGSAKGFGGLIKVQVTIKNGKISDIRILSAAGETASFFNRAKSLTKTIVSRQSTNVSAVSGATYSSNGIINAVRSALNKAKIGAKGKDTSDQKATKKKRSTTKSKKQTSEDAEYEDGTYEGTAQGFGGPVKVKVTIKNGKITSVKIVSAAKETEEYLKKAQTLTKTIVDKQTADVDVVTGATYSSNGIINAVKNALSKARKKSTKKTTATKKQTQKASTEKKNPASDDKDASYEDGTYQGTGEGYEGDITLSVTIKNGKITAIKIISSSDDDPFFSNAKNGILPKVIEKQSSNVDIVTGATYSSEGILSAVKNALDKARKTETTTGNKEDTTTGGKEDTTTESKGDTTTGGKEDTSTEGKEDTTGGKEDITTEEKENTSTGGKEDTTTEDKEDATTEAKSVYKDGTYSVSVTCEPDEEEEFRAYTVEMSVVIQDDKIIAINNITGGTGYVRADKWYLETAKSSVAPRIVSKGTPDGVDAVSEATCSSKAILEGCRKALEQARN